MATDFDEGPRAVTSIVTQSQLLMALSALGTSVEPDPGATLDDSPLGRLYTACLVLGAAEVQAMHASTAAGQTGPAVDPWRALDETARVPETVANPTRSVSDRAQLSAWYAYRIQRLQQRTADEMTGTDPITTAAAHTAAALRNLLRASHAQEVGAGSARGQEFLDAARVELEQVTDEMF